ncbi:hypothetical protein [Microvirga sp. TS319]|uniref:hypothetical protein n=1 Tax=Microvirga sp. TS319 TaxID=3241165 RepID=UPI00351AA083
MTDAVSLCFGASFHAKPILTLAFDALLATDRAGRARAGRPGKQPVPVEVLPEKVVLDLILLLQAFQALVFLNVAVDILDLPLVDALARQPRRLRLCGHRHDDSETEDSRDEETHGNIPLKAIDPYMAMGASSGNGGGLSPAHAPRGISGLDAVRLLIHGRADESA